MSFFQLILYLSFVAATNVKIIFSPLDKLREIGRKVSTTTTTPTITTRKIAIRTTTVTISNSEECKDGSKLCTAWAKIGRCQPEDPYRNWMSQHCKKTCQFCTTTPSTAISTTTISTRTISTRSTISTGGNCKDSSQFGAFCAPWASAGRCHDEHQSFMRLYCPVTCSFCISLNFT